MNKWEQMRPAGQAWKRRTTTILLSHHHAHSIKDFRSGGYGTFLCVVPGEQVQCWPAECGQNVHLARGLIFASVLKVFEGVGAIWEGPDGAPPGSQGGPRPPPQNTTISLRQGAFGVQCTRAVGAAHILVYRSDRQQLMSGMSTDGNVCIFAHFPITGVCLFHRPGLYVVKCEKIV